MIPTTPSLQIIEQVTHNEHQTGENAPSQHQLGERKILTINGTEELATLDATNAVPWNYEVDALRDILLSMTPYFDTPRWVALVRWYELFGVKSNTDGLNAALDTLRLCLSDQEKSSYQIYKCFMEQMDTLPSALKDHFKSKTLADFNKVMRRFGISSQDQRYIMFDDWSEVEDLLFVADRKHQIIEEKYKYEYDGTHPFAIRILVGLRTVLGCYFKNNKYFFDPEHDQSVCSYAKGVHFYVGNYAARDYGIIPENYKDVYTSQLHKYVVHAVMRLSVVSNFDQTSTDSNFATHNYFTNPAHFVMHRMFNVPALADWVIMNKKGTEIINRRSLGLTMDDHLLIF